MDRDININNVLGEEACDTWLKMAEDKGNDYVANSILYNLMKVAEVSKKEIAR